MYLTNFLLSITDLICGDDGVRWRAAHSEEFPGAPAQHQKHQWRVPGAQWHLHLCLLREPEDRVRVTLLDLPMTRPWKCPCSFRAVEQSHAKLITGR